MLKRALGKLRDGLVSLAYPEMCRVCGGPVEAWTDGIACADCWNDPLKTRLLSNKPVCERCGAPLDPAREKGLCGGCGDAPYATAKACGIYSGTLEASVLFLKTHPHICGRLRAIIDRSYRENRELLASDLIIPVPLARTRRRERGFNQAAIIAKTIRPESGAKLDESSLVRIKHTERHRAGMDKIDRARSVARAFKVVRPRAIEGASILLVDDLYTTGSTVTAATRALLEAGAERVSVFTLARVWRV
ncbi:MAG TPA: double zinc ribbon domain-containing protein [Blastocatellia bacterium]|nr:double zinc ribbon domain-containing protein [Blastocatellia bacterium]